MTPNSCAPPQLPEKGEFVPEVEGQSPGEVLSRATLCNTMLYAKLPHEGATAPSGPAADCSRGPTHLVPAIVGLLLACAAAGSVPSGARAAETDEAVAISSRASRDYVRPRLANGSAQAETYAFGNGGPLRAVTGGAVHELDFMAVAKTIAGPLAAQNYISANDPKSAKLLIMVYWGTTCPPERSGDSVATQNLQAAAAAVLAANSGARMTQLPPGTAGWAKPTMQTESGSGMGAGTMAQRDADNAMTGAMAMVAAENNRRDQLDAQNALMLGYESWWEETAQFKGTPLEFRRQDLIDELEASRYFVVLMAYDFQMMWKEKKAKMLWETRFSVRQRDNDFTKRLAAMAASAAPFFGRDSGRLVHRPLPDGRVDVGPIKVLAFDQKP